MPKPKKPKTLRRKGPLTLTAAVDWRAVIEAGADSGDGDKLREFSMMAYNGGSMYLIGWWYPVVVDIAGLRITRKPRPILKDHSSNQIVGHTTKVVKGKKDIALEGVVSGATEAAREVVESADNGFPWQASVGVIPDSMAFIPEGKTATANGETFSGPLYIARKSRLGEVSFVALGADDSTSARVLRATLQEGNCMTFEQWLIGLGFEASALDDKQTESLQARYDTEMAAKAAADDGGAGATPVVAGVAAAVTDDVTADPVADMRAKAADESTRISAIRTACGGQHAVIEAQAIKDGWTAEKAELAVLRAARPDAPAIHAGSTPVNQRVLEAAVCMAASDLAEDDLATEFGNETMEAARPMRNIGLRELTAACARMEGAAVPPVFGDGRDTIRAGFATVSLPGIIESVLQRTMIASYEQLGTLALKLCKVASVSDFKEVTRYRLLGTGGFSQVGPAGELKSAALGEQSFTNQANTYGQILTLTRQDVVNDDLNAFLEIPREMGRSGAAVIDDLFFTLLLSNPSSFFSSAHANLQTGAASAFDSEALTTARAAFRSIKVGPGTKEKNQRRVNVAPKLLLVPVELETDAEILIGSANLQAVGSTDATAGTLNPHRNKYEVVAAPQLSDDYYTGYSATAWYLFGDPKVIPAFEIVFLNGVKTPTIERVATPANVLGLGFRGYIDAGVKEQDYRGANKSAGA